MKKYEILYITDDYLFYKKKNREIIEYKINKDLVYAGRIRNIKKFKETYEKFITSNNLNKTLFGENLKVIVNLNYNDLDIKVLKEIMNSFNYKKVSIDKVIKCYKLNKNNAYLNIFDNYLELTYLDEFNKVKNILVYVNSFKNINDLMKYINYIIEDREIYLLGYGDVLEEIFLLFENKFKKKTYIFNNAKTYVITAFK